MSDDTPRRIRKAVLWVVACILAIPALYIVSLAPVGYFMGRNIYRREVNAVTVYLFYAEDEEMMPDPIQQWRDWGIEMGMNAAEREMIENPNLEMPKDFLPWIK